MDKNVQPRITWYWLLLFFLAFGLLSCTGTSTPTPTPTPTPAPLPETLRFYYWEGYMPQSVLDAFAEETGIKVEYIVYETVEEAVEAIKAEGGYDVVGIENYQLPTLIEGNRLAELNYQNLPNYNNISASFRNLSFDPENRYTVPFSWGVTGIVVRTDRVEEPITTWEDLWDPRYQGKVGVWPLPRDLIGMSLKTLGYSINSEEPAEVAAAVDRLIELKKNAFLLDLNLAHAASFLLEEDGAMIYGWAYDYQESLAGNENVVYVLPEEGTMLWGESLLIPASSPHKEAAEQFINFILRPESSAQIVNEVYVANANEAARPYINPDILNDPSIFPPNDVLQKGELFLPLSAEGEALHAREWERFMEADQ
ncbi:MAG: spermidine/putrescine ABC transporter substrate-binding protein [Ardenticatenales bacterium]|nr:spermidine/putrescine ABC transporter substrate-binding protein [Ardenticatenales bacterium]